MDPVETKRLQREALERDPGLATAYLFGPSGTASCGPESDIDLAVLFTPDGAPCPLDVPEFQEKLTSIVHVPGEVVLLNRASPVIGMQRCSVRGGRSPSAIRAQRQSSSSELTAVLNNFREI